MYVLLKYLNIIIFKSYIHFRVMKVLDNIGSTVTASLVAYRLVNWLLMKDGPSTLTLEEVSANTLRILILHGVGLGIHDDVLVCLTVSQI